MSQLPSSAIAAVVPQIPFEWLRERRWFSSKGETLAALELVDWGELPLPEPAIAAIARARYESGRVEQYFLPLVASRERSSGGRTPFAATLDHDVAQWFAHDALQFSSFQRLLMERLISGDALRLEGGHLLFEPEAELQLTPPPLREIKLVTAEQSNSSIIYDRQAILKVFRRVVAGLNPDVEVSRFLGRAGFEHTPRMLGSIAYRSDADVEHSLGLLQSFVPNEGDAWDHTLEQLRRFLAAAADEDASQAAARTPALAASLLGEIRQLGVLTAEMHRALSTDADDPDFAPQPLTGEQIERWQRAIHEQADAILETLARRASSLPSDQRQSVDALLAAKPRIERRIEQLQSLQGSGAALTRFHGDYHLGQVLASERGFLILDFEGEPLRSLAERRAHSSPLKDVAGMLRSLSYAAQTALREAQTGDEQASWVGAWEQQARDAFVEGYLGVARGAAFVPDDNAVLRDALAVFELEKALYELKYELNNRPDWLPIPLSGIQRVI